MNFFNSQINAMSDDDAIQLVTACGFQSGHEIADFLSSNGDEVRSRMASGASFIGAIISVKG
jgi:hypothetical protein